MQSLPRYPYELHMTGVTPSDFERWLGRTLYGRDAHPMIYHDQDVYAITAPPRVWLDMGALVIDVLGAKLSSSGLSPLDQPLIRLELLDIGGSCSRLMAYEPHEIAANLLEDLITAIESVWTSTFKAGTRPASSDSDRDAVSLEIMLPDGLDDTDREIVRLRRDGMTDREIGEVMGGYAPSTISGRITKIRKNDPSLIPYRRADYRRKSVNGSS